MTNHHQNPTRQQSSAQRLRVAQASSFKPQASSGISLTEVLISLGVLAVGLLGVAAIFPVGGALSARGDQRDRADAVAQAALNDAITRGLLDPENWVAYEDLEQTAMDKRWLTNSPPFQPLGAFGTYTRPFAADYRARLAYAINLNPAGWSAEEAASRLLNSVGSSIVIDPQGVGAIANSGASFSAASTLSAFPASVRVSDDAVPLLSFDGSSGALDTSGPGRWSPWSFRLDLSEVRGLGWPVQRVSVTTNVPRTTLAAEPMLVAEAERIVLADDDLAIELPEDGDDPSQSRFTVSGTNPLLRQARQEYSWLLTVAPTTFDAHRALANGGDSAYDVSAVVFNRRTLGTNSDLGNLQASERLVRVSIQTNGIGAGGGEVLFFRGGGDPPADPDSASGDGQPDFWWQDPLAAESAPWEDLRPGQWVYLFGPHTRSTNERPLLFAQWYQVVAIDDSQESNLLSSRLRVQLRGPDWPWINTNNISRGFFPTAEEGALWAVIVPDVVAVHTRTLNLQSGAAR